MTHLLRETVDLPEIVPGEVLAGRFVLERQLGRGGMGQVWLAADRQLDGAPTACKILRPALRGNRQAVTDLKREVLVTRKLRHPNIVPVYTYWDDAKRHFISMEYVEGESLAAAVSDRDDPFDASEIAPWVNQLAGALDYAHSCGVMHCDIKPSNVLLERGMVHLADFGIARAVLDADEVDREHITQGTLAYMSPEQLHSTPIDGRADQYGLAVTVYELLSKTVPFSGESIVTDIQFTPPPCLGHLSDELNNVLQRALSKLPDERYASCGVFAEAITAAALAAADPSSGMREAAARGAIEEDTKKTAVLARHDVETRRSRLGRLLIESKIIGQENLADALIHQQKHGGKLGCILVEMGFLTEEQLVECLSRQMDVPRIRLDKEPFDEAVTAQWSFEKANEFFALPIRRSKGTVMVAMADPLDLVALSTLEEQYNCAVTARLASAKEILENAERVLK